MWSLILPSAGTIIGGAVAYWWRRSSKSIIGSKASRQGSLQALTRACGQMVALHLFDRLKRIYLRINPKRTEIATQIEDYFLHGLGLDASPHSMKQLTAKQEE